MKNAPDSKQIYPEGKVEKQDLMDKLSCEVCQPKRQVKFWGILGVIFIFLILVLAVLLKMGVIHLGDGKVEEKEAEVPFSDLPDLVYFHFNDYDLQLEKYSFKDDRPYPVISDTLNEEYRGDINWFAWALSDDKKDLYYWVNPGGEVKESRLVKVNLLENNKQILSRDEEGYYYESCLFAEERNSLYCLKDNDPSSHTWWDEKDLWEIDLATFEQEKIEENVGMLLGFVEGEVVYTDESGELKGESISNILSDFSFECEYPLIKNDRLYCFYDNTINNNKYLGVFGLNEDLENVSLEDDFRSYLVSDHLIFYSHYESKDRSIRIKDLDGEEMKILIKTDQGVYLGTTRFNIDVPMLGYGNSFLVYEERLGVGPAPPIYMGDNYTLRTINIETLENKELYSFHDFERIKVIDWLD